MKIAIVIHNLNGGGAEKMMARLANGLASLGDEVVLVLLTGGGVNKSEVSEKVRLVELNAKRTFLSVYKLVQFIRYEKPDRILSALTHVNVVAIISAAITFNLNKLFVSERNAYSLDRKVNNNALVRFAYFIAPFLYRMIPNNILSVSEGVKLDLIESAHIPSDKISVLPNPVLENDFLQNNKYRACHPWLVEKLKPVIIAVGRLSNQKGFDVLIDAFSAVVKVIDCRLIIYGEGSLRTDLEGKIRHLGIDEFVSMPGYSTQVLGEMQSADLFVLSSRFEGSPNVLVEAISTGVPVISTDCPYGPSEILNNGDLAPLVPVDSSHSLADEIIRVLSTPDINKDKRINSMQRYTVKSSSIAYRNKLLGQL